MLHGLIQYDCQCNKSLYIIVLQQIFIIQISNADLITKNCNENIVLPPCHRCYSHEIFLWQYIHLPRYVCEAIYPTATNYYGGNITNYNENKLEAIHTIATNNLGWKLSICHNILAWPYRL